MKARFLLLTALTAVLPLLLTSRAQAVIMLNDFQGTGFGFDYGSWTGNITTNPTHVSVTGATEQGGAGTSSLALDLSSYLASGQVSIEARLIAGNAADNFNVILFTTGSDLSGYQFSTSGLNTSTFTTLTINLSAPSFTSGSINWSNITMYQVQGDYSSTDTLSLEFRNLQIIPEPSVWALLGAGLGVAVILRRRTRAA